MRSAIPTALLFPLLLCAPVRARAYVETCTLPAGRYEWTAPCAVSAGEISGCDCNAGDPDLWRIPAGAEVTCPTGPGADDVELAFTHPLAAVAIEEGGSLELASGCALGVPGDALRVDGALRVRGKALSFGGMGPAFSADRLQDSLDPTLNTLVRVSQVVPCPGSDDGVALHEDCAGEATFQPGSRREIALCFPEDALHSGWLARIRAGDVLAFWDPTEGLDPPRDVNAFYRIDATRPRCLVANVLQGGESAGYGIEKRELRELTLSSDYPAGSRRIEVGTDAITADKQGVARWLTCRPVRYFPDGSEVVTPLTQKITRVEDDAAGDWLELLPGGFPRDLPAGTACHVDYGWLRGDAISVWRPAGLADGTAGALGDSEITCSAGAACDFDFALLANRARVNLGPSSDIDDSWLIDAAAASDIVVLHLRDWTGANVSERVQMTAHATDSAHSVAIDGEGFEGGTLVDWNLRHSEDDYFVPNSRSEEIQDQSLILRRLRIGFMGCSGGSCAILDANAGAGSGRRAFNVDLDGLLAEDPSGEQRVSGNFYHGGAGSWTLRNLVLIAGEQSLFEDFGGVWASQQETTLDNVYDIGRDVGTFSTEILGAVRNLSNVSLIDPRLPAASAMLRWSWPFGGTWERILVLDPHNNYPVFLSIRDVGAPLLIRDLAIVGFDRSAGSGGVVLEIRPPAGETDPVRIEDMTLALRPGSRASQRNAIALSGDDATFDSQRTLRGLLVAGFAGTPEGSPALVLSPEDLDGVSDVCTQGNEADGFDGTVLGDAPLTFAAPELGDYRQSPSSPGLGICGARAPGASDMWALRVLHHDPYRFGDTWKTREGSCGDGAVAAGEACDDGGLRGQDGCSPDCRAEDSLPFSGTAMGGIVELEIDGHRVALATLAGQTPAQVAAALAAQIGARQLPGVTATAAGDTLWVTGRISAVSIADPGLSPAHEIPLLPAAWLALLALVLGWVPLRAQLRARGSGSSGSSSNQLR